MPEDGSPRPSNGSGRGGRPGEPSSDQRRRAVARLAAHLTETARGGERHPARASAAGRAPSPTRSSSSFPWRRRGTAEAAATPGRPRCWTRRSAGGARSTGWSPRRPRGSRAPSRATNRPCPTRRSRSISITGTNGKTTTVRLLAHLVRSAGRTRRVLLDRRRLPRRRRARRGGRLLGVRRRGQGARPASRRRGPRDRARRDPAPRDRRAAQRRRGRDERLRGPPRPARDPHARSARRGEGHGHEDHAAGRLGRAERGRPARARDAPGRDGQAVALLARSRPPGDPRRARRGRPRHGPARRVDDGVLRLAVVAARAARSTCRSRSRGSRATTS